MSILFRNIKGNVHSNVLKYQIIVPCKENLKQSIHVSIWEDTLEQMSLTNVQKFRTMISLEGIDEKLLWRFRGKVCGSNLNGFVSSYLFEKQEFHCLNSPLLFLFSLLTFSYIPGAHLQFNLDFFSFTLFSYTCTELKIQFLKKR